jgi:hypothetical protein
VHTPQYRDEFVAELIGAGIGGVRPGFGAGREHGANTRTNTRTNMSCSRQLRAIKRLRLKARTSRRKRREVRGRRDRKPSPVLASVAGTRVAIIHLGCASPRTSSDATRRLGRTALERLPISSCSEWGLPCNQRYRWPGELLPRLFTLTVRLIRDSDPWNGGRFSAALSLGLPPPAVDWHPVLWSSDFPPAT